MSVVKITNHNQQALDRLLEQYKGKPNIKSLLSIYAAQIQEIEDIAHDMFLNRMLNDAVGRQLDNLGQIVGVARQGLGDNEYRVLILVKIGQNSSQGTPEDVITVLKLLPLTVPSERIHYMNLNDACIMLATAAVIPEADVNFIYTNIQRVPAAGVRIDHLVCYEPELAFALAGVNGAATALGLSNLDTPTDGGKFAKLKQLKIPFAFAGNNPTLGAFGSIKDPVAGGVFVGL